MLERLSFKENILGFLHVLYLDDVTIKSSNRRENHIHITMTIKEE